MTKNGKFVRNVVWITFIVALVLVNVIAEVGYRLSGIEIDMFLRTFGVTVLAGSAVLIRNLEGEKSLSGNARDTLGADRAEDRES